MFCQHYIYIYIYTQYIQDWSLLDVTSSEKVAWSSKSGDWYQGAAPEKPSLSATGLVGFVRKSSPNHRWIINNGSHHGSYIYIMAYVQLNLRKTDDSMMNMCSSVLGELYMTHMDTYGSCFPIGETPANPPRLTRSSMIIHTHRTKQECWLWWSQTFLTEMFTTFMIIQCYDCDDYDDHKQANICPNMMIENHNHSSGEKVIPGILSLTDRAFGLMKIDIDGD